MPMKHIIVDSFGKTSGIPLVPIWLKSAPDTVIKNDLE